MRRLLILLAALMLIITAVLAEDAPMAENVPMALREADTAEEVAQFLLFPTDGVAAPVQRGYIRYISQSSKSDTTFLKEYWLGGEEGSVLDLTLKERYGSKFAFHTGVMCTRAAYSMILSYFGIDMSPGKMSEVLGKRNLDEPYTEISEMFDLEFIPGGRRQFNTMVQNYLNDDSYSPIYLYFRKPDGTNHAVIVVGYIPDPGRYLVVDSNPYWVKGEPYRVYFVSLNKSRNRIINSTFANELVDSTMIHIWQWRLPEQAAPAEDAATAE